MSQTLSKSANDTAPAVDMRVPALDTDFPQGLCRALYVGASGDISVRLLRGVDIVLPGVPVGILPVAVSRINTAGTTVPTPTTNIRVLY
jgi:hypothetical protein